MSNGISNIPFFDNYTWYLGIVNEISVNEEEVFGTLDFFNATFVEESQIEVLKDIKKYCELDEKNMNPIFDEINLVFVSEKRKKEITYELIVLNSKFLPVFQNNEIVAYFQYTMFDKVMYINELQMELAFRNKVISYRVIKNILHALKNENPKSIYALLQYNNKKAMKLYKKFGFKEVSWFNESDLFLKTDCQSVLKGLKSFINRE